MPQKNSFSVKTFAIAPSVSIFITCWLVAFHSRKYYCMSQSKNSINLTKTVDP